MNSSMYNLFYITVSRYVRNKCKEFLHENVAMLPWKFEVVTYNSLRYIESNKYERSYSVQAQSIMALPEIKHIE